MITEEQAAAFGRDWIDAWNRHDLDAILSHYDDAVVFCSPFVAPIAATPSCLLPDDPPPDVANCRARSSARHAPAPARPPPRPSPRPPPLPPPHPPLSRRRLRPAEVAGPQLDPRMGQSRPRLLQLAPQSRLRHRRPPLLPTLLARPPGRIPHQDRKSTRLNSSHQIISYAVFCLKKKKHH